MSKKLIIIILIVIAVQLITIGVLFYQQSSVTKKEVETNQSIYKLIEQSLQKQNYSLAKKLTEELILKTPEDKRLSEILDTIELIEKEQKAKDEFNESVRFEKIESLIKNLSNKLDVIKKKNEELAIKQKQQKEQQLTINNETIILNQSELDKAIDEGRKAFENNNLLLAKDKFLQALKYDGNNATANAYYGAVIYEENPESDKNINEASERIMNALKTDNYIEIAHLTLAKIYDKRGQKENALLEFNYAIKLNPNNFYTYYILGKKYYDDKNYEKAQENLLSAVRIKSDLTSGFYYLAESEVNLSMLNEAKIHFEKVISLDSNFFLAYLRLGDLAEQEKNYENAINYYNKGNELSNNYETLYKIASCYTALNNKENALAKYQASLSINAMTKEKEKRIAFDSFSKIIQIIQQEKNEEDVLKYSKLALNLLKEDGSEPGFIGLKILVNRKKYPEAKEMASKINGNKLSEEQKTEFNNIVQILNKK